MDGGNRVIAWSGGAVGMIMETLDSVIVCLKID